MGNVTIL